MKTKSIVFAIVAGAAGTLAALAVVEAGLQIARFQPGRVNSGYLQFGYQSGIPSVDEDGVRAEGRPARVRLFEPDADLLWVPIANTEFTNSQGLRGRREYDGKKPPGTLRVVFIGDSCTFLGDPVYPEIVERQLTEKLARPVECLNASSPGYSSFQGVQLLNRIQAWEPDAVVVYFGWNDHWRAHGGLNDTLQHALGHEPKVVALVRAVLASRRPPTNRVPLGEYATNLDTIRNSVAGWGAVPVFITAPTAFRSAAMPSWAYSFYGQFYKMDHAAVDGLPALHHAYADQVRRAAAIPPARLVDAEADFAAADVPATQLFRNDSIHLRNAGHQRMATLVSEALAGVFDRK